MATSQLLIEQIHASGKPLVIAVTGGGSGAISRILEVPGASASVLEAIVPYSATALAEWLGGTPDHYCSERTARAMAMAAFERARKLSDADPRTLRGIGATASLASNRPKRGPHRIHIAWQSADTTVVTSSIFAPHNSRADEEGMSTQLILNSIAHACAVDRSLPACSDIDQREHTAPTEWTELLLGSRTFVARLPDGGYAAAHPVLFPGAFNPIHRAHRRMAEVAAERCGKQVTFELSITNVDKPPLDFIEIADRLQQFQNDRVLLTRAPTFVEKAGIAPDCVFVVGVDTLERIGDPIYYHGDAAKRNAAIEIISRSGCRFLVFGRALNGKFETISDVNLPSALRALCDEVPESDFREDISSTKLRNA